MSENNIYEITQMISNKKTLQSDLSEAMEMVNSMFKKKYIDKLQNVVQSHHIKAQKNPSKEIQLMYAIKPFLDKNKHTDIDKLINTMITLNAVKGMQDELSVHSNKDIKIASIIEEQKDKSIQEDGIYDIDESCITSKQSNVNSSQPNMANLMLLLIFSNMNKYF